MCVDFEKIDLDRLERKMREDVKETSDPIFGDRPLDVRQWSTYPKWHGLLINKTLLEFIRAAPGWEGELEYKFVTNKRKKFVDNLVFNKSKEIVVLIECKRDLDQAKGGAQDNIELYEKLTKNHKKDILKEIGIDPHSGEVHFCVFDAYGPRIKEWNFSVIYQEQLGQLFGSCMLRAWNSWEKSFLEEMDRLDFPVGSSFRERVRNFKTLRELSEENQSIYENDCGVNNEEFKVILEQNNNTPPPSRKIKPRKKHN